MSEKNVPEVRFRGFSGEWENDTLGAITDVYDGTHQTPKYTESGIMFLSIENIKTLQSEKYISENDFINEFKVFPQKNDVLMTRIGDVGTANVVDNDTKKAYYVSLALLKYKKLNSYFLRESIHSQTVKREIWHRTLHIAFPKKFNKNEIEKVNVLFPNETDEQTKIGEFFKNLDDLIAQNQKKYDKLVNMKKAYLDKMFPKNGADTPEVRFQGFRGEWEKCNLKEASQSLEYGLNAAAIKFDGKNKYIRITDIDDELRTFLETDLSSPCINLVNSENYKLQKGDIVFARTGASVGKSYKYNETDGLLYYAGFLIRSRIKPEYDTTFIFQNTLTKKYKKYIQITSQRSGQPGVNAKEYSEFSFCAPIFDEQTKIGIFFQTLDNLITLRKTELEKLKNIKKACLDKMFI